MARFETEVLTQPRNLAALMAMPGQWVDRVRQAKPIQKLILDLDSSVSETYGQQEGSAYNGHVGYECYHPLFCFNQDGDMERAILRNGNVEPAPETMTRTHLIAKLPVPAGHPSWSGRNALQVARTRARNSRMS